MLTTKRGTRTAHTTLDRGSVRVSITECVPILGHPRRLNLRVVTEDQVVNVPCGEGELADLHFVLGDVLDAPTTEIVRATELRLGDIITELKASDVMVESLGQTTNSQGRDLTLIHHSGGGTWIAMNDLSNFTVRLPRPVEVV